MNIRPERPADYPSVEVVIRRAFAAEGEVALVNELRREPDFIPELSLVATLDEPASEAAGPAVVGHIFFSPITIDGTPALALAPLAVLPEFQRTGIGQALVRAGLERARQLGHRLVVVVGHAEYYPRFGFAPARPWGLEVPFPVSDASFMVCELVPEGLAGVSGLVTYAPPFGRLS